ncbi:PPE domain-containing protein [Nocardia colli]|uniref:PPE domain-containing protein n=1 Tax=Nocardia colli TaxID=2545717 RepID=A0A5N0E2D4_9NOCA|nr:PPE domain-containing protein [Nocardia colli]KAA8881901.1 PPE domain-containing protein [Nocardia colli]
MELNVDPVELTGVASRLAGLAQRADAALAALPEGWVRAPAADAISRHKALQHNENQAAPLLNGVTAVTYELQHTAHEIGASAVDYSSADDAGGRTVGGGGADILANPVPEPAPPTLRSPPPAPATPDAATVDTLKLAEQLRAGPGIDPATKFTDGLRGFLDGAFHELTEGMANEARTLRHWTPVGAAAAADLDHQRRLLEQFGAGLRRLAHDVDTDSAAFVTARDKHPTPAEIKATRKELLTAMRSKNPVALEQAMAEFEEQNARSAETITGYSAADPFADTAADSDSTGESSGIDMNTVMTMLPTLLSAISAAAPAVDSALSNYPEDYGSGEYGDYADYGDYAFPDTGYPAETASVSGSSGAPPLPSYAEDSPVSNTPVFTVGPMPTAGAPTPAVQPPPGQQRAPVIDQLSSASSAAAANARGGMPYMPMMPMAPGAGGAAGVRPRNVEWNPNRLMFVDDTPHTEQVIGERPTIAPTVTPATPARTDPGTTSSGGSV